MAVESIRGCGFRKVGGLYMCGEGSSMACDRLPYELVVCPTCGAGVKFSRGFQWLNWYNYAGEHEECKCSPMCPICHPAVQTPLIASDKRAYGLLWIGDQFYTPEAFIAEALEMGVSRRIATIPRKLKLGETWVILAHIKACGTRQVIVSDQPGESHPETENIPGVFYAFRPQRIEKLIWESDAKQELLEDLEKSSITPIIIPDGDPDHDPKTPLLPSDDERERIKREQLFGSLREKLAQYRG